MFEEVRGAFTEEAALSWASKLHVSFPNRQGERHSKPREPVSKGPEVGKALLGWRNLDERAKRELAS